MNNIKSNFATVERDEGVTRIICFNNDNNFNLYQYYKDVSIFIDAKGLLTMTGKLITREYIYGETEEYVLVNGFTLMPEKYKIKTEISFLGIVLRKKSVKVFGFHKKERDSEFIVNGNFTLSV